MDVPTHETYHKSDEGGRPRGPAVWCYNTKEMGNIKPNAAMSFLPPTLQLIVLLEFQWLPWPLEPLPHPRCSHLLQKAEDESVESPLRVSELLKSTDIVEEDVKGLWTCNRRRNPSVFAAEFTQNAMTVLHSPDFAEASTRFQGLSLLRPMTTSFWKGFSPSPSREKSEGHRWFTMR